MTLSLTQLVSPIPGPIPELASRSAPTDAVYPDRLYDAHGRQIRDLRLSLTDRCNMRCTYCMDPGTVFAPRETLLTADELIRLASVCAGLGVTRVRLTGGEPTVRPELTRIIRGLADLGLEDLSMTTNGVGFAPESLDAWKTAGLGRVTFSLDTLDPERFTQVTRSVYAPSDVIASIRRAAVIGLGPVRVNCVVVRGFNDDEVVDLARLAADLGVELRLIEFMPLDGGHRWDTAQVVPSHESRQRIERAIPLRPLDRERTSATATRFGFADGSPGGLGFVSPVSQPFCGACSRLRITAQGQLRACLFGTDEGDLRTPMRTGADDESVRTILRDIVWNKRAGHGIGTPDFERPAQAMNGIGG
ncbi:MAG: cyclic pyranopterin phosphate synthase [Phycisphaerales bacterium]|jgi:cyclic pyranopterin phosphate synthase